MSMNDPTTDLFTFFIFVIPGFITVWSYRYFKESKDQIGDFEYLAKSSFWGLIMFFIYALANQIFNRQHPISELISNPYFFSIALSILGYFFGWYGVVILKISWVQKFIKWLKNYHF